MKFLTKNIVLKNKTLVFSFVNIILIFGIILFLLFENLKDKNEIVFIDKIKVFEDFQMTKESKAIGEKEFSRKKIFLDSLYINLQRDLSQQEKETLMQAFIEKREELDSFSQNFGFQESEKIWKRLSQYSEEFSNKNGYKLIILTEKGNNVLSSSNELDVTTSFLKFANSRYNGFKK